MSGKIVLLDGFSLIYRAYHGLQAVMNAPDGTPTNAIHGFMMMLLRVIDEEKPDGLAIAFDMHAPTFRKKMFDEYKGTRPPMPDDLRAQEPIIRELIEMMHIPSLEIEGFEADDIFGTISARCENEKREIVLVTGDRDSFQLSGEYTTILYTKRGITETVRVTPEYILETYGVSPKQMIDVKGLMGDTSDNIPGVPGIGEKTALKLIKQYGSLEKVLETADKEQKGKLRERLMENADQARLSCKLATIVRDVPIAFDLDAAGIGNIRDAIPRLRELGMNTVIRKLNETADKLMPEVEIKTEAEEALPAIEDFDDSELFGKRCAALCEQAKWVSIVSDTDFTVETDSARLCLRLGGDLLSSGIEESEAFAAAKPLMNAKTEQIYWNVKALPYNIEITNNVNDVMLAAYALNPQRASFTAQALCEAEGISDYAAFPATALRRLAAIQKEQLRKFEAEDVYRNIEMPLAGVLRDMESVGFLTDADVLREIGTLLTERIAAITEEIDALAGEKINLNSPKQLGELLFVRMGIPAPKKTSRGYSTNAEVLESLADEHPICAKILEYRKYQKLQSTYIDSLLKLRDESGRIHTRFDQVSTATGRISSLEPNLQNIPVRTEMGREIRRAFIAKDGCVLVDADYSQIELRVLAHISGDETMISAFNQGQDIHARTASEVFGVPIEQVTSEMRSRCKAVNFGIVYGISDFSLAKNIGVARWEAREFIERYFARYPGVKAYMDKAVREGHENGYVMTLMKRRRYLPELESSNFNLRSFGERCAMNSPIQGTAADIIKLAMISVDNELKKRGLEAKLILQVHDELIIESPEAEAETVKELLIGCMENVITLAVPLKVDLSVGRDWRACK